MATHLFRARPGIIRGSAAGANPLDNIRMAIEPPGELGDFIASLTGTYDAFQKARICQTWLDLHDSALGLASQLDRFSVIMANEADSLLDWIGDATQTNNGATFTAGSGFVLDGVDDYIGTGLVPSAGGLNFSLAGASCGVQISDPAGLTSGEYALGRAGSGGLNTNILPITGGGATAGFRINGGSTISGAYTGNREGLWSMRCSSGGALRGFRNSIVVAQTDAYTMSTLADNELAIGRQGDAYAAFTCGGWFFGNDLNITEMRAMSDIINAHVAAFKS